MKYFFVFIILCILPLQLLAQAVDIPQQIQERAQDESGAGAQAAQEEELVESQVDRLQLAISNEDYPVTPGDVYRITFSTAGNIVSNQIFVESDYTINLGVFGEIDVHGMNFPQLKKRVEKLILEGYPDSLPSLTMISTGTFEIPVIGEIPRTQYVTAWGWSRLSDVVDGVLGRHSSSRDIQVISHNGDVEKYDLWMAQYKGYLNQNPLVKPGDKIRISRIKKTIQVKGEVYRPDRYQLLENESIQDIKYFSGGFTPLADLNRITIERFSGEKPELIVLNYNEYKGTFEFKDRDIITVPSKREQDLQVTVVGAVFEPGRYEFTPPETYMYYINLAGGIDFERNSRNKVTIVDKYGNSRDPAMPIMPGDTVTVLNNDFVYNFNRYFPVVTSGFAFILTIIQIINLANQ